MGIYCSSSIIIYYHHEPNEQNADESVELFVQEVFQSKKCSLWQLSFALRYIHSIASFVYLCQYGCVVRQIVQYKLLSFRTNENKKPKISMEFIASNDVVHLFFAHRMCHPLNDQELNFRRKGETQTTRTIWWRQSGCILTCIHTRGIVGHRTMLCVLWLTFADWHLMPTYLLIWFAPPHHHQFQVAWRSEWRMAWRSAIYRSSQNRTFHSKTHSWHATHRNGTKRLQRQFEPTRNELIHLLCIRWGSLWTIRSFTQWMM